MVDAFRVAMTATIAAATLTIAVAGAALVDKAASVLHRSTLAGAPATPTAGAPTRVKAVSLRALVSGTVRTDTMWAQSLGIKKSLVVYLPPSYGTSSTRRYPVLVYLHGLTGNERNWVEQGKLATTLDSLAAAGKPEAIVVMPDGDDGWYTTWNVLVDASSCRADSVRKERVENYCVPWPHYDDYIARDVVGYVDSHYRTLAKAEARGIAGLSMGGYGAVALALLYPDVFSAAASHSGVVSPTLLGPKPFVPPGRFAFDSSGFRLASGSLFKSMSPAFGRDSISWYARDPARIAARLQAQNRARMQDGTTAAMRFPHLMLDCGRDDPYIDQNRALHEQLKRLGIEHRYSEWPGKHDWNYWHRHSAESAGFLLEHVATR